MPNIQTSQENVVKFAHSHDVVVHARGHSTIPARRPVTCRSRDVETTEYIDEFSERSKRKLIQVGKSEVELFHSGVTT